MLAGQPPLEDDELLEDELELLLDEDEELLLDDELLVLDEEDDELLELDEDELLLDEELELEPPPIGAEHSLTPPDTREPAPKVASLQTKLPLNTL